MKWLHLLINADTMDSDELRDLLVDPPYREAIGILEMISKTPEELQFYEARLKFLRDQQSQIEDAEQKGIVAGKIQALEEILGDAPSTDEELLSKELAALQSILSMLQHRLGGRHLKLLISKTPEDLQFYEARLKFLRDQQSQFEHAELRGELKGSVRTAKSPGRRRLE